MKDSIKKFVDSRWILIVCVVIVFAVIRLSVIFSERDGHHVDETWSYGYANSYYDPYIFTTSRYGDQRSEEQFKNIGEWISGDVFRDYITVGEDQKFSFDSVIYNKYNDLGPALYTLILHFVSSLFPGRFSWLFAFSISVLFYILTLILVYSIVFELTGSKGIGLFGLIYFCLTGSGTANFIYLRIYFMFTFFALFLFYLIVKIYKSDTKLIRYFALLPFVTILGCLTQYFYLVIAFLLTLFTCLFLLVKKRIKAAFAFGVTMLLSVICFFLIYPQGLQKLLPYFRHEAVVVENAVGYSYPYYWEIACVNRHFFNGTVGLYIEFTYPLIITVLGILGFTAVIFGLVFFLFRNEQWMKNLLGKTRRRLCTAGSFVSNIVKNVNTSVYIALFSSVIYGLIIPFSVSLMEMNYAERYLFPAMSLFLVFYVSIIGLLIKCIIEKFGKGVKRYFSIVFISITLALLLIHSHLMTNLFRFSGMGDHELKEMFTGSDCYIQVLSLRDMVWFSSLLTESDEVYIDYAKGTFSEDHSIPELNDDCVLVLNANNYLTEAQKAELDSGGGFSLETLSLPKYCMTADDYVSEINEFNGSNYCFAGEYETFIGKLLIYSSNSAQNG